MSSSTIPWTGPGLIQSFIAFKPLTSLTQETLENWFEQSYIPALLSTDIVTSASTWKAANPNYKHQNMITYKVADLAPVKEGKLREEYVSTKSDMFPDGKSVDDFIVFESRVLAQVEEYAVGEVAEDAATTVVYAGMQPEEGNEKDLDQWYREEHNEQMSKEPGYVRTLRYRQIMHTRSDEEAPAGLDFVALHEFAEGHKLGVDVEPLDPMTEWTRRAMQGCSAIDAAIFHREKKFGGSRGDLPLRSSA